MTACVRADQAAAGPLDPEANSRLLMVDDAIANRVRSLAEAFVDSGLARLQVKEAAFEVELRRTIRAVAPAPAPVAVADAAPAELPLKRPDVVTSDLVGVVRLSRPQVNVGQQLESDRELAFVEALGIRNPVRSHGPGTIAAVFVSDGQPVEYGQPLFAIERS